MVYGSVCSGIEAATAAWAPLGWRAAWFAEIAPFPCALLAHHYPDVPNRGDMTRFKEWPDAPIDVLVGGTPCQSFSVAGLRRGLADPRGNLLLTYLAIAARHRPRWLVWENVPGVLSNNNGRDFGTFLGALGALGYGFAYRVLDAQYFALAQRRERVFAVGYLGDWRRAAAVLFERASLQGHPVPRREAGEGVAAPLAAGSRSGSGYRYDADTAENLIARCVTAGEGRRQDYETCTLVAFDTTQVTSKANRSNPQPGDPCHPLTAAGAVVIAFHGSQSPSVSGDVTHPLGRNGGREVCVTLTANGGRASRQDKHPMTVVGTAVRRLTPLECERLMGFPDHYTRIPYKRKPAADTPRYQALGNSMPVPVMAWIGRRMALADGLELA